MGFPAGTTFDQDFRDVIKRSRELTVERRTAFITSNHLLIAALDHPQRRAGAALDRLSVSSDELISAANAAVATLALDEDPALYNVPLAPEAEAVVEEAAVQASTDGTSVNAGHLLLAMVALDDCDAGVLLKRAGVEYLPLRGAL